MEFSLDFFEALRRMKVRRAAAAGAQVAGNLHDSPQHGISGNLARDHLDHGGRCRLGAFPFGAQLPAAI